MKTARVILSLFVVVWFLAACGSNGDSVPTSDIPIGLRINQGINVQGQDRNYHLFLPANPASAQIVFLLHGNTGSADQILGLNGTKAPFKFWIDIAERENLILVVPDGAVGSEGHQGWNDCRSDAPTNPTTNDVLFLGTLLDTVSAEYTNQGARAFFVGISNGGLMSQRLADEIPDKLQALAVVVASRPLNTQCVDSSVPISILFMNGTDDPILPYEGGHIKPQRGELFSTPDTVAYWVNRNQANTVVGVTGIEDLDSGDNSTIRVFNYLDGIDGTRVRHYEVVGGGHTEPSIGERYGRLYKLIVGEQNNDIEMAEEIWSFFSSL